MQCCRPVEPSVAARVDRSMLFKIIIHRWNDPDSQAAQKVAPWLGLSWMSIVYEVWWVLLQPQLFYMKNLPPSLYCYCSMAGIVSHGCAASLHRLHWTCCSWNLESLFRNLQNMQPRNNNVVLMWSTIATAVCVSNVSELKWGQIILSDFLWMHLKFSVGLGPAYFYGLPFHAFPHPRLWCSSWFCTSASTSDGRELLMKFAFGVSNNNITLRWDVESCEGGLIRCPQFIVNHIYQPRCE